MNIPHLIIGSGPAAVAAAWALTQRGLPVRVIDYGLGLEPERQERLKDMQDRADRPLSAEDRSFLQGSIRADSSGVDKKLAYGSDFPYRDPESLTGMCLDEIWGAPSLALGGFSNVWGGAAMPYNARDIADWPITPTDLASSYEAVLDFMPLAATCDELADQFPLTRHGQPLAPSPMALSLETSLKRHARSLKKHGVSFGRSRLAVHQSHPTTGIGCRQCGQCLYGCPYELVYNSCTTLEKLQAQGRCEVTRGVFVQRLEEGAHGITVHGIRRGQEVSYQADKVLVACGPLASARLILQSLNLQDREVKLRDSHYFIVPLLRLRGVPDVRKRPPPRPGTALLGTR